MDWWISALVDIWTLAQQLRSGAARWWSHGFPWFFDLFWHGGGRLSKSQRTQRTQRTKKLRKYKINNENDKKSSVFAALGGL